jgi:RHS repeat-associated protein
MESQKIYNPLNLPAQIWASELCDIDFQPITYIYSIDGVKLQQIVTPVDGQTTSTYYYGPMVLNDGELEKIRHSYGQMREIDGDFEPVFHIADNLGSPRVIFWDEDGDGVVREDEVLERIDYYPFGLEHGRPVDRPEQMESHFRYTDQEHIPSGVPYYDYVSRLYDPALGRFLGVDDHAFNYLSVSPFAYVGNNPLVLTDPDGRDWYRHDETDQLIWYQGSDPREGYTHIGETVWFEGERYSVLHEQKEIVDIRPNSRYFLRADVYSNYRAEDVWIDNSDVSTFLSAGGAGASIFSNFNVMDGNFRGASGNYYSYEGRRGWNQYTGTKSQMESKLLKAKWATRATYGFGALNYAVTLNEFNNENLNTTAFGIEMTSTTIGTFAPPMISIPWTIGYEGLGRHGVARIPWYQNTLKPWVRKKFSIE